MQKLLKVFYEIFPPRSVAGRSAGLREWTWSQLSRRNHA